VAEELVEEDGGGAVEPEHGRLPARRRRYGRRGAGPPKSGPTEELYILSYMCGVGDEGEGVGADGDRAGRSFGAGLGDETYGESVGHGRAETIELAFRGDDERVVARVCRDDALFVLERFAVGEARFDQTAARPELFADGVCKSGQFSSYEKVFAVAL
jgi:hypothetical protein